MADIFEEVEEGLRQDRMTQLWKKYGVFAYLAGALIIGGVAFYEYRQYAETERIERFATSFEAALTQLDAREYGPAAESFTSLIDDKVEVSPVAAHFLAQVRLDGNGDVLAASETLTNLAQSNSEPQASAIYDLALIKAAYLQADTLNRGELETLVAPLLQGETGFSALAQELIAAKALQEGDMEAARRGFTALRLANDVPPGVMIRANQALASMPPAPIAVEEDHSVAEETTGETAAADPDAEQELGTDDTAESEVETQE